jgi:hypothetical protein
MEVDTTSWTVGFIIAGLIVVVVAAVVLAIITLATRIRDQVIDIVAALHDAEANTAALWQTHTTVRVGHEIFDLVQRARHRLEA